MNKLVFPGNFIRMEHNSETQVYSFPNGIPSVNEKDLPRFIMELELLKLQLLQNEYFNKYSLW